MWGAFLWFSNSWFSWLSLLAQAYWEVMTDLTAAKFENGGIKWSTKQVGLTIFYRQNHDVLNIECTLPGKGLDAVLLRIVNTEGTIDS